MMSSQWKWKAVCAVMASVIVGGSGAAGVLAMEADSGASVHNGEISAFAPPVINTVLPNGVIGAPYQVQLTATGTGTITWSISAGKLPDGLGLANGIISGTPEKDGTFTFTVKADNGEAPASTKDYTVKIEKASMPPPNETYYTIAISSPARWYTNRAPVQISISERNNKPWKSIRIKTDVRGTFEDYTDEFVGTNTVTIEITENGAVVVQIEDMEGKIHTKSKFIECIDREPPQVRVGADRNALHIDAIDDLSGISNIYVDGVIVGSFNDKADVPLSTLGTTYPTYLVTATDKAGNRSQGVSVTNPNYKEPTTEQDRQRNYEKEIDLEMIPLQPTAAADTTPPKISAAITGDTLQITVTEAGSGMGSIFVFEQKLDRLAKLEGQKDSYTVSMSLQTLNKPDQANITINAVDKAGNWADSYTLPNPTFDETKVTPESLPFDMGALLAALAAQPMESAEGEVPLILPAEPTQQPPREPNPFVTDGNGKVIDNATDKDLKEFYTVETAEGLVFYIVVDKQQEGNNAHILTPITIENLEKLVKMQMGEAPPEPQPVVTPAPVEKEPEPVETPPPPKKNNLLSKFLIIAVVAVLGAGGYYLFKSGKLGGLGKKEAVTNGLMYGDEDEDEGEGYDDNGNQYDYDDEIEPDEESGIVLDSRQPHRGRNEIDANELLEQEKEQENEPLDQDSDETMDKEAEEAEETRRDDEVV